MGIPRDERVSSVAHADCHIPGNHSIETTLESKSLLDQLQRLWRRYSTAVKQLREATTAGDKTHPQKLVRDIPDVQEPLATLTGRWEVLLLGEPLETATVYI